MVDSLVGRQETNIHYTDLGELGRRYSDAKKELFSPEGQYKSYKDSEEFYKAMLQNGTPIETRQIHDFLKFGKDLLDKQVMLATHDKSKLKEWGTDINDLLKTREFYELAFQETLPLSERSVSYKHEDSVSALHDIFGSLAYETAQKMFNLDRKFGLKAHPLGVKISPISYLIGKIKGENLDRAIVERLDMMDYVARAVSVRNFVIATWPRQ